MREAGSGKPVILLHDSPRSSRLHLDTIRLLAPHFRVFALDTPGYGNSDPLHAETPAIGDFAAALGDALEALGLVDAPIYATHTSAKIALEYAASTARPPALILDGLSFPETLAPAAFIDAYMRPFIIDAHGAYIAAEWTRTRDMLRWFPWFATTTAGRMAMETPSSKWIEQYTIDLFSAGPDYSGAYAAAMRYDCGSALRAITVPTLVAARRDDVLYGYLDRIPVAENPALSIERLESDRTAWGEWLLARLHDAAASSAEIPAAAPSATGYIDHAEGQIHVLRRGPQGDRPLLILEASSTLSAMGWQDALCATRDTVVPDLPGFGESEALDDASAAGYVAALATLAAHLGGKVDVLAIGPASYLALAFAETQPGMVGQLILDGATDTAADPAALCPPLAFDMAGGHLHRAWHMLRDGQVQWPWYSGTIAAQRKTEPVLDGEALHRALLGVIKQPARYGDAMRAAFSSVDASARIKCPTLVFTRENDPFYAAAPGLGGTNTPRPDTIAEAAALVAQFLDTSAAAAESVA
ncbi:hypothetical protein A8V01_06605 [Novosphingobium guangzhouense]|uniref:AB hydrolase-1 domain-containing protein n=1 Tax=Novosphingobium guangzhouense TaxID=1850347 RepID=A0A2K2FX61_9SPHN|nr:hypothetical protein A8V01_06605 [Novosphingobium guangzhouense]